MPTEKNKHKRRTRTRDEDRKEQKGEGQKKRRNLERNPPITLVINCKCYECDRVFQTVLQKSGMVDHVIFVTIPTITKALLDNHALATKKRNSAKISGYISLLVEN